MLCACDAVHTHQHCALNGRSVNVTEVSALTPQVTTKGRPVELKSVAVNRVQPHQMAVAAGDCHLRLYDRRMLSLTQPSSTCTPPVLSLAPPHLDTGKTHVVQISESALTEQKFGAVSRVADRTTFPPLSGQAAHGSGTACPMGPTCSLATAATS